MGPPPGGRRVGWPGYVWAAVRPASPSPGRRASSRETVQGRTGEDDSGAGEVDHQILVGDDDLAAEGLPRLAEGDGPVAAWPEGVEHQPPRAGPRGPPARL